MTVALAATMSPTATKLLGAMRRNLELLVELEKTDPAGVAPPKTLTAEELLDAYTKCGNDPATFGRIESQRAIAWQKLSKDDKARVKAASDETKERIERASRSFDDTPTDGSDDDADDRSGYSFDPDSAKGDEAA